MSEFKDWYKKEFNGGVPTKSYTDKCIKMAWDYQQEKIDNLESKNNNFENRVIKAEKILVMLVREKMNGYDIGKILCDTKENSYILSHIISCRDKAKEFFGKNIKRIEQLYRD